MEDNLRQAWRDTANSLESSDSNDLRNVIYNNNTALDRLAQRYKRFATLSLCCIFMSVAFMNSHIFPNAGLWLPISMMVYFMTASIMDWWLYYGIKSIDCQKMTVVEVVKKAYFYRKRHFQFMAILFPLMIALFCGFVYVADGDRYIILGIALGGAVGLVLGFVQLMRFLSDYRSLK